MGFLMATKVNVSENKHYKSWDSSPPNPPHSLETTAQNIRALWTVFGEPN